MSILTKPVVSIVLGSYNRRPFLSATLESVRSDRQNFPYEIIVVDGGSTDGSLQYLTKQKDVITIIQHNRGIFRGQPIERKSWGYFMNLGFKAAQGTYLCMISDDCLLIPGALKNGVEFFESKLTQQEKIGAVAFYWRNWPEQKEYWVGTFGNKLYVNHGLFLRKAVEEVGWIDEESYNFYHADTDLCLKLWQAGYDILDCKTAFVEHCDNVKPSRISNTQDYEAFIKKWTGIYYDPKINNVGEWIYQSYIDPYQTYRQFPASGRIMMGLNKALAFLQMLLRVIKKRVRQYVFPQT